MKSGAAHPPASAIKGYLRGYAIDHQNRGGVAMGMIEAGRHWRVERGTRGSHRRMLSRLLQGTNCFLRDLSTTRSRRSRAPMRSVPERCKPPPPCYHRSAVAVTAVTPTCRWQLRHRSAASTSGVPAARGQDAGPFSPRDLRGQFKGSKCDSGPNERRLHRSSQAAYQGPYQQQAATLIGHDEYVESQAAYPCGRESKRARTSISSYGPVEIHMQPGA
jgi:hypothetical protein